MNKVCANKPNCISSFESREKFKMKEVSLNTSNWENVKIALLKASQKHTQFQIQDDTTENHLHLVATTKLRKYKDDLYFWFDPNQKTLNYKSESRVGYWDLGKNRSRMTKILKDFKIFLQPQ